MTAFDPTGVRARYPALSRRQGEQEVAFLDGPGGTQVPDTVIAAMRGYLERGSGNTGGASATSREADQVTSEARIAIADLFGCRAEEVVFGQNMTSLTFALSRALARTWQPGDRIAVTRLDHDANVAPWTIAAAERDVTVDTVDFDPAAGCALDLADLERVLARGPRLLAITHASNAVGTIPPIHRAVAMAREAGAVTFVDAVHYTPHGVVDVAGIGCDFLVASAYKFFGPHIGAMFGRSELLERLDAYKIRPAPDAPPGKWETGTQSFESLAGVTAAVDYLASLGDGGERRTRILSAMGAVAAHEARLADRFLAGIAEIPGVTLYGPPRSGPERTPTFAVSVAGWHPADVERELAGRGIFVWSGHYYAVEVLARLGLLDSGGLVRIGFVHYNTPNEVDRVLDALGELAKGG